jgi:DNA-binding response OmpR family regulator
MMFLLGDIVPVYTKVLVISAASADGLVISKTLTRVGFEVATAVLSRQTARFYLKLKPDLIIMNGANPRMQNLLGDIRKLVLVPIISIGPRDEHESVTMLELGADRYISEPIRPEEFVARVQALFRFFQRFATGDKEIRYLIDSIQNHDSHTKLTPTELRLLTCLFQKKGKFVQYSQLLLEVWGDGAGLDTVHYYARRLRNKMDVVPAQPYRLVGARGHGYCLRHREALSGYPAPGAIHE